MQNGLRDCTRRVEFCLEGIAEAISCEDYRAAQIYCELTRRLASAMRMIQDSWPWIDIEGVEASWSQYERGELMEFEAFENELLKATE